MFRKMLLERFDSDSLVLELPVVMGDLFVMMGKLIPVRIDDFIIMGSINLL